MRWFIWGAGLLGKYALQSLGAEYVAGFIDSDRRKFEAGEYLGKRVYSPTAGCASVKAGDKVMVAAQGSVLPDIEEQLELFGIKNWEIYCDKFIVSFCTKNDDVILSFAFQNFENIFYIDIGANDPVLDSVTKYLYAFRESHGINVEPQPKYFELLQKDRKRDINICAACGPEGTATLYLQSGFSTLREDYKKDFVSEPSCIQVPCIPLKKICEEHVPPDQEIHILKIDVEGYERQVLLSGDFERFRPWVIEIEGYDAFSMPIYTEWEEIILKAGYHFVMRYNFDRFYVANEHSEMDGCFREISTIEQTCRIIHVY